MSQRREEYTNDAEREEVTVIVNLNHINQNADKASSRSRFETFESEFESNAWVTTQSSSKNQMNIINCYNCEKSDYFSRNNRQFRKMNFNHFLREMKVQNKNDLSSENLEIKSRKE